MSTDTSLMGSVTTRQNDDHRAFRAKRGDVRFAIMSLLFNNRLTGYELMKKIREKSGGQWRVSSGSIYPQLDDLRSKGIVSMARNDGIYSNADYIYLLSNTGRQHYVADKAKIEKVWENFTSVKFSGTALEVELQKLEQALGVLDGAPQNVIDNVTWEVSQLRKKIYANLAE